MANNPNAKDNLVNFKKGQSGNPKGRPKLPDLRNVMAEILGEEKNQTTGLKRVVKKLQELAEGGNIKAAEVLLSRGYGLPKQSIDHTTGGESFNERVVIVPAPDMILLATNENQVEDTKPEKEPKPKKDEPKK